MKLNLTAVDSSQEKILAYLQQNASENLADKINNGTPCTKDNLQLINKKDLNSFMSYATEQARKLAANGASYACVDDATVFGWVMHYFEEESIEGKLYNSDGTEYKPVPTKTSKQKSFTAPTTKVEPPKPQQEQRSLWDMLEPTTERVENKTVDSSTIEPITTPVYDTTQTELAHTTIETVENNESIDTTPIVELDIEPTLDTTNIDADTGEVLEGIPVNKLDTTSTEPVVEELATTQPVQQEPQTEQKTSTFDRETMIYLATLLDGKIHIA